MLCKFGGHMQGARDCAARRRGELRSEAPWLNVSNTSGRKISNMCEKHIDKSNVGAGNWLVHNFELNNDCGFCQVPDSSEPYASLRETDSDAFDYGAIMY